MKATHTLLLSVLLFAGIANAQDVPLLNGSVAVNASSHYAIPFSVPEGGGSVVGRFTAQGSINTFILDQDGYTNFRGGVQAPAYYNSGNIIVANVNVPLTYGSYYLVFQNRNILANKTVFGEITLKPKRRKKTVRCTVKRGGATLYREDDRQIKLRAGARLTLIEFHGNAFAAVMYGRIKGTVAARQVLCK